MLQQEQETQAQPGVLDRAARSKELIDFARSGDRVGVEGLLDLGLDPNYTQQIRIDYGSFAYNSSAGGGLMGSVTHDESPLVVAARKGHLEIVQLLVSRGANVGKCLQILRSEKAQRFGEAPEIDAGTALSIAIREKQERVALYLISISENADIVALLPEQLLGGVNKDRESYKTLLHLAVESQCSLDVIQALRLKGCSATVAAEYPRPGVESCGLLFLLVVFTCMFGLLALGSRRLDSCLFSKSKTSIELAASMGRHDIAEILRSPSQAAGPIQQTMVLDALSAGSVEQNQQPRQPKQRRKSALMIEGVGHLITQCNPSYAVPSQQPSSSVPPPPHDAEPHHPPTP